MVYSIDSEGWGLVEMQQQGL